MYIPKGDGKQRPLGIPTVRDRVAQMAVKLVIEPIFEADFLPCSHGFRPKRKAVDALEQVRIAGNAGRDGAVDADIEGYFDTIDQDKLLALVAERISDRKVLKLLRQRLEAGLFEDGSVRETLAGTHRKRRSIQRRPDRYCMNRWPSPKAEKRVRKRVHELTDVRGTAGKDVRDLVKNDLNPVLRGWGNYFKHGNPSQMFRDLDLHVARRLKRWMGRRGGQRTRVWFSKWPMQRLYKERGLHHLSPTVTYLSEAAPRGPVESRVRENRKHGLTGGFQKQAGEVPVLR